MRKSTVVLGIALLTALMVMIPMSDVKAQETLIWEAYVASNGWNAPVTSPVLDAGREYRIEAFNRFYTEPLVGYTCDAQYYTTDMYRWVWLNHFPAPDGHSFLQIDGGDVNWGPFSNGVIIDGNYYGHNYSISWMGTGAAITFSIMDWIDMNNENNICSILVRIFESPTPPEAETAYAYGGGYATCFKYWGFKNWGWSNGLLGHGYYTFDIYAGAAKCNINKGTLVGTLTIDYVGSTATITYMMDAGWMMQRTQLYVGSEPLPMMDGDYTTSPGHYTYIHDPVADPTSDTFTATGLSGGIYVVAHADVFEA